MKRHNYEASALGAYMDNIKLPQTEHWRAVYERPGIIHKQPQNKTIILLLERNRKI